MGMQSCAHAAQCSLCLGKPEHLSAALRQTDHTQVVAQLWRGSPWSSTSVMRVSPKQVCSIAALWPEAA